MQIITFNTTNAFIGLESISVYLLIYFCQVALSIIVNIFMKVTGEKCIKKNFYQRLFKSLFFNSILSITMEGFLEFLIYGFLNIYVRDASSNGEILGLVFAFICILLIIFLLNSLIWSIILRDEAQLASEEFG